MYKKMNKKIKWFIIKWVLGQCPHFCFRCKYSTSIACALEYEDVEWKQIWNAIKFRVQKKVKRNE